MGTPAAIAAVAGGLVCLGVYLLLHRTVTRRIQREEALERERQRMEQARLAAIAAQKALEEAQRIAEQERIAQAAAERERQLVGEGRARVDIGGEKFIIAADPGYLEYIKDGFEPEMVKLFRQLATGSALVLDVGANIGCTAILFGGIAGQVHAFEPSHSTFEVLKDNVTRAGRSNVSLHNCGLGVEAGELTLNVSTANRAGAFLSGETQGSEGHTGERITIRTLDEVMDTLGQPKVDFLKIDTEGFEANVLRGATRTLTASRPVVVLELNHWCLNAYQRTSVPDFFDFLRSVFPILFAVEGDNFLDLHNSGHSYIVMYQHILKGRFNNIVGAFDEEGRIAQFRRDYHLQFFD